MALKNLSKIKKNVLVTGIGGNVGQGILRNISGLDYNIRLTGTNTEYLSAGNHLCDVVYKVPFSTQKNYIPIIKDICRKEKIDLIIPSTDYESYYLILSANKLPIVAASPKDVTKIFMDKYLTWLSFKEKNIPFAKTCLPSDYNGEYPEIIVKPAKGRGSREIYFNPPNPGGFSNDNVIQELKEGKEITTAFYVTKQGELLGFITFERTLSFGTTAKCQVIFDYDSKIKEIILSIINNFDIRGSCNIQSIVTDEGEIVPVEINCRISGTNSIRSNFGFEDVRYIIEEYLFNINPSKPIIKKGCAIRILMDVIYPDISLNEIQNKHTKQHIF